ncbi:MAG: hypothetical protein AMXMBFR84_06440 [Candidatus Hydrogenedentota bacterium]
MKSVMWPASIWCLTAFTLASWSSGDTPPENATAAPTGMVDFQRDIAPIFAAKCISCHGPEKQQSGLRLDHKADAMRGGDSGPVLVASDSANSDLFQRISGARPEDIMPPKGEPLSADQVALVKSWIDQGALWPEDEGDARVVSDHWAYQPIAHPTVPGVSRPDWTRNPIDNFVLARLEAAGISPAPEADRPTLIRRLYLDLLGLLPTPEDVDAFVNDTNPYAYESLINRLLASEHFGERWGRHWLDLARYADSDGYEKDSPRPFAYRYRDWVIDSINRDMPYDQFIVEQLAGDLLPNATTEQRMATGFHRNTLTNREGGVDQEEFRVAQAKDRINTTASALMGLTMACAECHTHKYDPITQREYYQMYSFFNTAMEQDIPALRDGEMATYVQAKAQIEKEIASVEKQILEQREALAGKLAEWEASLEVPDQGWTALEPSGFLSASGSSFAVQEDKSILVTGPASGRDKYTVVVRTQETGIKGFRIEALTDPSLPGNGPGRAHNGNFVLSEFAVYASPIPNPAKQTKYELSEPVADFEQNDLRAANAIDGDLNTGWAIYRAENMNENRTATFAVNKDVGQTDGTVLTFVMDFNYGREHNIGRFRLSYSKTPPSALPYPDDVHVALRTPSDQRTEVQQKAVLEYFGRNEPNIKRLIATLDALRAALPKEPDTKAQALAENPEPPKTFIHQRGDFLSPGEEVQAGTMAVLHPFKARGERPDRLDLARWIIDPANPLTARVQVNRMWSVLFGEGLVRTPEDFGVRGEKPTHPELLDWLATEFMAQGWSVKNAIRLITSSATYRQSSHYRTELAESDAENKLLARQNTFRVEAEVIRDINLAASGLINLEVGGPSVRPYMPEGIADLGYANSVKWAVDNGPEKYRRGLYIFFQRTVPYPMLMNFDCPNSNTTAIARNRSNTPLQALNRLNDPVLFECAQALGKKTLATGQPNDRDRVEYAFRACLGRKPAEEEIQRLVDFLNEQRQAFASGGEMVAQFAGGLKPDDPNACDTAAHVALARVIMNLNEFVTRE